MCCSYEISNQPFLEDGGSKMSLPVDAFVFKSVKSIMLENLNFFTFSLKVTFSLVIIIII